MSHGFTSLRPKRQRTKADALDQGGVTSTQVEVAVSQRLNLLRRLQEVDLSPQQAWALLERVKTNTSSAEERERLAHLIRATADVSEQIRAVPEVHPPPASKRPSARCKTKRKRQLTKAARRRQRA